MFDPIHSAEEIKNSYIDYITTTFDMADKEYNVLLKRSLEAEGTVAKGPYLDIGGSYETGRTLHELIEDGLVSPLFLELEKAPEKEKELKLERPLYLHQETALDKTGKGQSIVVTTGTGSGKTECFLLPVLQQLLTEAEKGTLDSGVRAIIIYPMNALANDQIKRMRKLLKDFPRIHFGIYNGNTKHTQKDALSDYRKTHKDRDGKPLDPLENEMISREAMQEDPPHILITNYSMLEYMMLRPKDDKLFSGAKLKYIILDEAHIYRGATGMETSLLMRRLRARISDREKVQYILTSATLGGPEANRGIIEFAKRITCGLDFKEDGIIRSKEKKPEMIEMRTIDPAVFPELRASSSRAGEIIRKYWPDYSPDGDAEAVLCDFFLRLRLFAVLRDAASKPLTISKLQTILSNASPGITREQVVSFISVCAKAEKDGASLIKPRYHFFVRALEGAYITIASPRELFLQRTVSCGSPDRPQTVFEAAVCTDCGRLALVGKSEKAGRTEKRYFVQHARQGREDDAEYYLLKGSGEAEFFGLDEEEPDETVDDGTHDYVVCPVCGAIAPEAELRFASPCEHGKDGFVKLRQADKTKSGQAKCPACGFGSFRRFYLGSEAATEVLGTELYEQLPTEEITEVVETRPEGTGLFSRAPKTQIRKKELTRQFLCFSDSRSEAAYFAADMERSYQEFLRRRGIWHTAEKLKKNGYSRIPVKDFVDELARLFEETRCFAEWDASPGTGLISVSRQNAWVAVLNEMFNSRRATSMASLGFIAFSYQRNAGLAENVEKAYGISWQDAEALLELLTQDAVFSGAITCGKDHTLTDAEREYIFFTPYEKKLVKVKGPEYSRRSNISGWCGRSRSGQGKRAFYPNSRIERLMQALGISEKDADKVLSEYWDGVFSPEGEFFSLDANDFDILLEGTDAVRFYRCRKCGRITPYSVRGKCAAVKCGGELEPIEPAEAAKNNHYVRLYMSGQMHPLYIKEHTAQLAKDQQTRYQEAFVNHRINALSCSTTFEMGVDVGSLETVYMRDVPPGPANYVQRAGRAGRSRGSAAFILTYAKLSSHDFTYYSAPERMISGEIGAPVFEVENEKILNRHINAVAISAFLKDFPEEYNGDDQTTFLNEGGYERLKEYLSGRPAHLKTLLENSMPGSMLDPLGISDWGWVDRLCGPDGVLQRAVEVFRGTVQELEAGRKSAEREKNIELAAQWQRALRSFRCAEQDHAGKKSLVSFLVRSNVLPKYGFPVDTVELLPYSKNGMQYDEDKQLQLSRDLQMAIADYAPGAQIVADGKLYTSRYIRKSPGKNANIGWEFGYYCPRCPSCLQPNFTKEPIGASRECVSCHTKIPNKRWHRTLEPRLGFGSDVSRRDDAVPRHRPEHGYKTEDNYIGDPQRNVLLETEFFVNEQRVKIASTTNDSLVVTGLTPFKVCPICGYSDAEAMPAEHKNMRGYTCSNREGKYTEYLLSHDFKTDAARITFVTPAAEDENTMRSVLYSLLEGLSREMEIERTDIKGCLFKTSEDGHAIYSIILYDAVAGGAGHVRRIVTKDGKAFQRVLERSLAVVEHCDCGSSCYNCLRNYYNQKIHDVLDRHKAAEFLRRWKGEMKPAGAETSAANSTENSPVFDPETGMNLSEYDWEGIWKQVLDLAEGDVEKRLFRALAERSELFAGKEKPIYDCESSGGEGYRCDLLWPKSQVLFFTAENRDSYEVLCNGAWTCFLAEDSILSPEMIAGAIQEE